MFLLLSFGVWLSVPAVLEKVALGAEQPPEEVHAMARGPLAAAGGLYEADMVAVALASVGVGIESAAAGLDFGCSSGRLVRVLGAAYPEVQWHGCDPNGPAIEWAARALPARQPLPQLQRAAAAAPRRLARPRLRDLDLVALRARARPALVR